MNLESNPKKPSEKTITLAAGIKKIKKKAFEGCTAIESINVPAKKATTIWSSMTNADHPQSTDRIGRSCLSIYTLFLSDWSQKDDNRWWSHWLQAPPAFLWRFLLMPYQVSRQSHRGYSRYDVWTTALQYSYNRQDWQATSRRVVETQRPVLHSCQKTTGYIQPNITKIAINWLKKMVKKGVWP